MKLNRSVNDNWRRPGAMMEEVVTRHPSIDLTEKDLIAAARNVRSHLCGDQIQVSSVFSDRDLPAFAGTLRHGSREISFTVDLDGDGGIPVESLKDVLRIEILGRLSEDHALPAA